MSNFEEEYNKRLRRVLGVTDDTLRVEVDMDKTEGRWTGYCETCEYYETGRPFVVVRVTDDYTLVARKEFEDMGQLIRLLDQVEL